MKKTTAITAALGAAAAAIIVAIAAPSAAHAAPSCTTSTGGSVFYPGASASKVYNDRFSQGFDLRLLSTHVPQGISYFGDMSVHLTSHWNRTAGGRARINAQAWDGVDKGEFDIYETHAGGIAVASGYLYVSGGGQKIRRYNLDNVRTALETTGVPYLAQSGEQETNGNSFLTAGPGGTVWAGNFDDTTQKSMWEYSVNGDGTLSVKSGPYAVPPRTQGVVVTDTHFIFSTSYGRTNLSYIFVVKRGYGNTWANATGACFSAPSMTQGLSRVGTVVYVNYESGSAEYTGARNVINHVHKASLQSLLDLAP
ncbi:hypothetical protein [Catellatospora vulcania]|uniref:hypothetical protein n=1 Tax=Catellatospora vulcania TaxID=1460450 RepID=UPI0012D4840A|nr:hypothetical protein [Catellatospora vulcania]